MSKKFLVGITILALIVLAIGTQVISSTLIGEKGIEIETSALNIGDYGK